MPGLYNGCVDMYQNPPATTVSISMTAPMMMKNILRFISCSLFLIVSTSRKLRGFVIYRFFSTAIAILFVNTDRVAAFRAGPSCFFVCNELSNSNPSDISKILDHAHIVFSSVSFIQMFHTVAGEAFTLKTIFLFRSLEELTCFDCAPTTSNGVVSARRSTTSTFIFLPQIRHANATVHSARGDQ
jgi:hypothetical protein